LERNVMQTTPRTLLQRLRTDPDEDSWRRLVDLYKPFLQNWCRQQSLQAAEIDDVVQDVLAVLVQELKGFEHNNRQGAFRLWLRSIALNRLRAHLRRRRSLNGVAGNGDAIDELADSRLDLEVQWEREHDQFIVRRAMELLEMDFTPMTWSAFRRQVVDCVKPEAVADELGMSINAVVLAKFRVMRRLKQELDGITD
jgi:RNA polymerase sigma-70 factor (ECF subfamily)